MGLIILLFIVGVILYIKYKPSLKFIESGCYLWYTVRDKYNNMTIRDYIKIY